MINVISSKLAENKWFIQFNQIRTINPISEMSMNQYKDNKYT